MRSCQSVCLSASLSAFLPSSLSFCLSVYLSVCLANCLNVLSLFRLCLRLSVCFSLSVSKFASLSIYLPFCLISCLIICTPARPNVGPPAVGRRPVVRLPAGPPTFLPVCLPILNTFFSPVYNFKFLTDFSSAQGRLEFRPGGIRRDGNFDCRSFDG